MEFAKKAGAEVFIDSSSADEMKSMKGSIDVVLNTIPGDFL